LLAVAIALTIWAARAFRPTATAAYA